MDQVAPPAQRLPVPRVVAFAIVSAMLAKGDKEMAILTVMAFTCYLRPHEGFELLTQSLVAPNPAEGPQCDSWAVIVNDAFSDRAGKTGLMDESVLVDKDQWLWPVLEALKIAKPMPGPLWTFSAHHVRATWLWAVERLSLQSLAPQPHSLRHGGASDDVLTRRRSLLEVKQRGRWSTGQSLRRYSKAARLQTELAKVPPPVVGFGKWIEQNFAQAIVDVAQLGTPPMQLPPPFLALRRS